MLRGHFPKSACSLVTYLAPWCWVKQVFISNTQLDIQKTSLPGNSTRDGETSRYCQTVPIPKTFPMCFPVSLMSRRPPYLEENPRKLGRGVKFTAESEMLSLEMDRVEEEEQFRNFKYG